MAMTLRIFTGSLLKLNTSAKYWSNNRMNLRYNNSLYHYYIVHKFLKYSNKLVHAQPLRKSSTSRYSSIMVCPALQEIDNAWIIVKKLFPAHSMSPVRESSL